MPVVALTGGIGSGKSAACARFAALGVPIIDTDKLSHQITAPAGIAIDPIRKVFGDEYIDTTGALDRSKMRSLVFSNTEAKKQLEAITHPLIFKLTIEAIQKNWVSQNELKQANYQIIAIPLFHENSPYARLANITVVIDCDPNLQIARTTQRSQLEEDTVRAIMNAQISREKRLALADHVIENNSSLNDLNVKIDTLHYVLNRSCCKMAPNFNPAEISGNS